MYKKTLTHAGAMGKGSVSRYHPDSLTPRDVNLCEYCETGEDKPSPLLWTI